MAGLRLEVRQDHLERLSAATAAIVDASKEDGHRYETGAPNAVDGLNKPSIRLQAAPGDASRDLSLTLVLQTAEHGKRDPIQERIGDGLISIAFE